MALAFVTSFLAPLVFVIAAGLLLAWALRKWSRVRRQRSIGNLIATDAGAGSPRTLRSERRRLVGRPDLIRQRPDGSWVPIELKSRTTPFRGPPSSHRIQALAYALLIEEDLGRSPPFAVLRYSDGGEFVLPWDSTARAEVLAVLEEIRRPYDGRAEPSEGKCRRCTFRPWCDVRAV